MGDKYDEAVAYLTENPQHIRRDWCRGGAVQRLGADQTGVGPLLFMYASEGGELHNCGCLTMIRGSGEVAQTEELTRQIREDERIPMCVDEITVESLPVFAEWQRRLDKELGREVPR